MQASVRSGPVSGVPRSLPIVLGPTDVGNPSAGKPELIGWIDQERRRWRHLC